jgi:hypothetical protein
LYLILIKEVLAETGKLAPPRKALNATALEAMP